MKQKEKKILYEIWDFAKTLIITMIAVFLIAQFVVRPVKVQGNSMYPTLHSDAVGLSNVLGYKVGGLERFDIAIIYLEEKDEYLVKRVVGLPGETISYVDGNLYVNGEEVEEPFLINDYHQLYAGTFMDDVSEITLGEDEYYCLGDNRPNSRDSRFYGPFEKSQIVAKGVLVLWPFNELGVKSW